MLDCESYLYNRVAALKPGSSAVVRYDRRGDHCKMLHVSLQAKKGVDYDLCVHTATIQSFPLIIRAKVSSSICQRMCRLPFDGSCLLLLGSGFFLLATLDLTKQRVMQQNMANPKIARTIEATTSKASGLRRNNNRNIQGESKGMRGRHSALAAHLHSKTLE